MYSEIENIFDEDFFIENFFKNWLKFFRFNL